MSESHEEVAGLTPEAWEARLEEVARDPEALAAALVALEQEMHHERSFLHENPGPAPILKMVLEFFAARDDDLEALGERLQTELEGERDLVRRYRSWKPGETWMDRIFPYVKGFAGEVVPRPDGLQFPDFGRYEGVVRRGSGAEVMAFFVSERFPGRYPANFYVTWDAASAKVVVKRVFKMDLPRIEGISTVGRAVLAELIRELVPDVSAIRELNVDNAANRESRDRLLRRAQIDGSTRYTLVEGADVGQTPLGFLMARLAEELGLVPGDFRLELHPFGVLEIELAVAPAD